MPEHESLHSTPTLTGQTPAVTPETLSQVFCRSVEELAFLFSDPAALADLPKDVGSGVMAVASMSFKGEFCGTLAMLVPESMAKTLAANILGLSEEEMTDPAACQDALGEMVNVVCGQLLTAMAGETPVFDLTPPVVQGIECDEWQDALGDQRSVGFMVDGNPVVLRLIIDRVRKNCVA